jgi:hypothetical protein
MSASDRKLMNPDGVYRQPATSASRFYSSDETDEQLTIQRESLHEHLRLPQNRRARGYSIGTLMHSRLEYSPRWIVIPNVLGY